MGRYADPLSLDAATIQGLLDPNAALMPELEAVRADPTALRNASQTAQILAQTEELMPQIAAVPATPYTLYRLFGRDGDRGRYEAAYFAKRRMLGAATLRLLLGIEPEQIVPPDAQPTQARGGSVAAQSFSSGRLPNATPYTLTDVVHDLLWSICEESNWVLPAHERGGDIDLFAAETAFMLAETLAVLGERLDGEVRRRVRIEVDRRIHEPYLRHASSFSWYQVGHNWNGVCNGAVAASFLLLDPDRDRVAQALALAFTGLRSFFAHAFEDDGSSSEGVAYWQYGLINVVALSELLRARTHGALDLLATPRMATIAAYPAKMHLSSSQFASFSDCDEELHFHPGFITRLAERTNEPSLYHLIARPARIEGDWRLTMMLRNLLWWDGQQPDPPALSDAHLPVVGVARLVSRTSEGAPIVLALKAGHNGENHNQNDIGSIVLNIDGENLLVDPGRGLYSRAYFGPQRYENVFANSYGHSVPRIDGQLQATGKAHRGELLALDTTTKRALLDLRGAYDVAHLRSLQRELRLDSDGTVFLRDNAEFDGQPGTLETALISWADVQLDGATARIHGQRHTLELTIEQPCDATFQLELLTDASRANAKPGVLRRITVTLPPSLNATVQIRMRALSHDKVTR